MFRCQPGQRLVLHSGRGGLLNHGRIEAIVLDPGAGPHSPVKIMNLHSGIISYISRSVAWSRRAK